MMAPIAFRRHKSCTVARRRGGRSEGASSRERRRRQARVLRAGDFFASRNGKPGGQQVWHHLGSTLRAGHPPRRRFERRGICPALFRCVALPQLVPEDSVTAKAMMQKSVGGAAGSAGTKKKKCPVGEVGAAFSAFKSSCVALAPAVGARSLWFILCGTAPLRCQFECQTHCILH
jgi:hypothetical protein